MVLAGDEFQANGYGYQKLVGGQRKRPLSVTLASYVKAAFSVEAVQGGGAYIPELTANEEGSFKKELSS